MKEYDICPTLISKTNAYKIFLSSIEQTHSIYEEQALEVLSNKETTPSYRPIGRLFTFPKFMDTLIMCAKNAYAPSSGREEMGGLELLDVEMLCLILERMELSKGFTNFEKRTNKPHTSKLTLLPNKQIIG